MPAAPAPSSPSLPTPRYANYVLGVMFVVTLFNVADRYILSLLLQPIKEEFGATDAEMGLLTGLAFGLFHGLASLPIAYYADRTVRRTLVAASLFLWSALTALSGLAQSYWQLFAARAGVAIAEGGGAAPGQSILADYFPMERRATAMAFFGIGGISGMGVGMVLGGWVNDAYGWRAAFFVLGVPGMLLALLTRLTVREPPRGQADGVPPPPVAPLGEVLRFLMSRRSFVWMVIASSFHAFASMGAGQFSPAFLIRTHGMSTTEIGLALFLVGPVMSAGGQILAGRAADVWGRHDRRWYMWVPAYSSLLAMPFAVLFVLWPAGPTVNLLGLAMPVAMLWMIPGSLFNGMWAGTTIASVLSVARPEMRALAAAILLATYNGIGMALGPLAVGLISDALQPTLGSDALRWGLLLVGVAHIAGTGFNLLAARTLREDLGGTAG